MATSTDGQHWEITFAFPVDPNDSTKYLSVPDAHYKWFVDGNPSPVADGGKWSDTCHYEYEERIVTADFTPPEDVVGCLENKAYPATCSAVEPTTFKYTFDACAPTCDADKKPSGCVENVGLQAAVDGLVKDDGEQLGYHWYERAAYAATSVAGSTEWTITFPLTVEHDGKDQVIAVPAAGSTYKWLVNGEYPEQEDTTNVQNVGCSAQYNEYNMEVWKERSDLRNCLAECPAFVEGFDATTVINYPACAFAGRSYTHDGGIQVPRAVADGNDCQAACAQVNTMQADSCAIWSYDYAKKTCHVYQARALPPTGEWFGKGAEFVSGPVVCRNLDVCFYDNAVYGNQDFGASGYAGLPGDTPVYVPTPNRKAGLEGEGWWDGAKTVTVEDIPTPEACQVKCAATAGCDFFDWTGLEGSDPKECWLKSSTGDDLTKEIGIKMGVVVGPKVCPDTTTPPLTDAPTPAPTPSPPDEPTDAPTDAPTEPAVTSGSGSGSVVKEPAPGGNDESSTASFTAGVATSFAAIVVMMM
jgi:hypothetical protein